MRHDRADNDTPPAGSVCAVFVRQPVAGQVKSRLAAGIGDEAAAEVYRAIVRDVLNSLGQSGCVRLDRRWPPLPREGVGQYDQLASGGEGWGEGGARNVTFGPLTPALSPTGPRQQDGNVDRGGEGGAHSTDFRDAHTQSGAQGVVAFSPNTPAARDEFRDLAPAGWRLWVQPEGTLGQRLTACFEQQFRDGVERVVVVGSDAPSLPPEVYVEAAERLADHDVVLGPALDGGYYLIGLRRPVVAEASAVAWQTLFEEIDWGGPQVLRQTVARVTAAGLSLALLSPWYDVDTLSDLQFLQAHLGALAAAGRPCPCPYTAAWLADREFP